MGVEERSELPCRFPAFRGVYPFVERSITVQKNDVICISSIGVAKVKCIFGLAVTGLLGDLTYSCKFC